MPDHLPDQSPGDALTPRRPLLRYLGSKWRLAPEIIALFPQHSVYVEPFGGGAAILLRKARSRTEVYNDLDNELINLFRLLRSTEGPELVRQIALTPYARREYEAALSLSDDPLERARRLLIRSHMGHGTRGTRLDRAAGFRSDGTRGTTRVAGEWSEFPEALAAIVARLQGVAIEARSAEALIDYWDDEETLFYLDPPYMPSTRSSRSRQREAYHAYAHEMTVADHEDLLAQILKCRGMIILSGYPSDLYDSALKHWHRIELRARSHRNTPRTEVIWVNPLASSAMPQRGLFASAAA